MSVATENLAQLVCFLSKIFLHQFQCGFIIIWTIPNEISISSKFGVFKQI